MTPELKPNTKYRAVQAGGNFTVGNNYTTDSEGRLPDNDGYYWSFPVSASLVKVVEVEEGLSNPEFGWTEDDGEEGSLRIPYPEKTYPESVYAEVSKGGPSGYYDMPFKEWITTNDQIEYLAEHKWGKFSPAFKDIFKALVRWGDKAGVDLDYDAKKIVYYGARVLRQIAGTEGLRSFLQELLDDEQFK